VKILLGHHGVLSKSMLLFDGSDCSFRKVRVRDRNPSCAVCGSEPSITALIDYEQFCGSKANDKVIILFGFFFNFLEYVRWMFSSAGTKNM
jgi:adenylyltransferase/sulfurtransferase